MKFGVQLVFFMIGIMLFSYGIAASIKVQHLGIHPWDVLNIALFNKFGLTIGTWSLLVGIALVIISLLSNPEYVRFGTILNALMIGPFIDLYLYLNIFLPTGYAGGDIVLLLSGIGLMGIGGGLYSAAGIGAGPRDGFMLSLSDKFQLSISRTRIYVESLVLLIGLILGGPVFVFTFVYTFIQSPIFQFAYVRGKVLLQELFDLLPEKRKPAELVNGKRNA